MGTLQKSPKKQGLKQGATGSTAHKNRVAEKSKKTRIETDENEGRCQNINQVAEKSKKTRIETRLTSPSNIRRAVLVAEKSKKTRIETKNLPS